tara:strand:+ start:8479 stop:8661 length:183 start_codon:yes stop_codon:yes gene_type:complete
MFFLKNNALQLRVYLVSLVVAYLVNSFGIFWRSFLFTKLVTQTMQITIRNNDMRNPKSTT